MSPRRNGPVCRRPRWSSMSSTRRSLPTRSPRTAWPVALRSAILGPLFAAADPASKAITQWQVYDTAGTDSLVFNGTDYADHSAASALTTASLTAVSLLAGSTLATDTLDVRAYNGSYWGDWTTLTVAVTAAATRLRRHHAGADGTDRQPGRGGWQTRSRSRCPPARSIDPQNRETDLHRDIGRRATGRCQAGWCSTRQPRRSPASRPRRRKTSASR